MYLPAHFKLEDLAALDALARHDPFATMVTVVDGAPFATHLPLLYERADDRVTLRGHWSRANPQWRTAVGQTVLVMLHGPHAYVSPTWYADRSERVPTWNYIAAHLYGDLVLHQASDASGGRDALRAIVAALSDRFEAGRPASWQLAETGAAGESKLDGIVGFTLRASRIELKAKLHSHHPPANQRGVIDGLRQVGSDDARAMADWMEHGWQRP